MKLPPPIAGGIFAAASLILVVQISAMYMISIPERDLPVPGLHRLPFELGSWKARDELSLGDRVAEYLRPDEYILRDYVRPGSTGPVGLFVAYFKSLQKTYGPHSPRVCLPGSGWLVEASGERTVHIPGRPQGIRVNEYLLQKSGERILVFYWYQNGRNTWSEEFQAKLQLLPDLIRYRRSDVSLVRITTPVRGEIRDAETENCVGFTEQVFPRLSDLFESVP